MKKEVKRRVSALLLALNLSLTGLAAAKDDTKIDDSYNRNIMMNADVLKNKANVQSSVKQTIKDQNIRYEGLFDNYDDANIAKLLKIREYATSGFTNVTSAIIETEVEKYTGNIIEVLTGTSKETKKGIFTTKSKEEAESKKKELEVDNHDKKITVTIRENNIGNKEDIKEFDKTFDSIKEAKEYIESLKKDEIKVESKIDESIVRKDVQISQMYDNKDEFVKAYDALNKAYENKNLQIEIKRDISKDTNYLRNTYTFDTKEEAEAKAKEISKIYIDTAFGTTYNSYEIAGSIREINSSASDETRQIDNQTYSTKEEAQKALDDLVNEGYEITSSEITENKVLKETSVNVDNQVTFDENVNYIVFKQSNGLLVIWTSEEKNDNEKSSIAEEYIRNHNEEEYTFHFLYGYGDYPKDEELSPYTFSKDDEGIKVYLNTDEINGINYIKSETGSYTLNALLIKKSNIETKYAVDEYVINYGNTFSVKGTVEQKTITYRVTGKTISKTANIEYVLDEDIETKKYQAVKETVKVKAYKAVVNATIPKELKKNYPDTPKTGDKIDLVAYGMLGVSALCGALSLSEIIKNKKKNDEMTLKMSRNKQN